MYDMFRTFFISGREIRGKVYSPILFCSFLCFGMECRKLNHEKRGTDYLYDTDRVIERPIHRIKLECL
jgi:hypothetical protein